MARLEDITIGSSVIGIAGGQPVSVVAVKWYGSAVLEITFKDHKGQLANQLLYREDEERLDIVDGSLSCGTDSIISKAAKKMIQNEALITQWAPALLLMEQNLCPKVQINQNKFMTRM